METIREEREAVAAKGKAQELFKLCDRDDKGFVTGDDLRNLREDLALSSEQIEVVFSQLDRNGDGFLTAEEFENGLELFLSASLNSPTKKEHCDGDQYPEFIRDDEVINVETTQKVNSDDDIQIKSLPSNNSDHGINIEPNNNDEPDFVQTPSETYDHLQFAGFLQDNVHSELWSQIQEQHPELLPLFEDFLRNLSEKHEQILNETAILKQSFYKKSTEYEHQIHVLYEEMESQIKEERDAILNQKFQIESQLRQELDETVEMKDQDVQELLTKWLQASTQLKEVSDTKIATENENQKLLKEKELLELQLDTYKLDLQQLHEKLDEFKTSSVKEKRQQFWSINRRLQDENDELGDNVLQMDTPKQLPHGMLSKRGSVMSDYFGIAKSCTESASSVPEDAVDSVELKAALLPTNPPKPSNPFLVDDVFTPPAEAARLLAATNPFLEDIKRSRKTKRSTYTSFSDPDLDNLDGIATPAENVPDLSVDRKTPALCLIHPNNHQVNGIEEEPEVDKHEEKSNAGFTEDVNANIEGVAVNAERCSAAAAVDGSRKSAATAVSPEGAGSRSRCKLQKPGQLPESLFKIVFIGDSGVGKTSLINRICGGIFQEKFSATIGVDFKVRNVIIDGHHVHLQLWDTAGQERFRSITTQYLRKSDGVLIAYDATSELSFRNVSSWISSIEDVQNDNVVVALLGNKSDLAATNKVIPAQSGKHLAEDRDALFFETSAKDGTGVEELVMAMARKLQKQQIKELESCVQLTKPATVTTKKMCC